MRLLQILRRWPVVSRHLSIRPFSTIPMTNFPTPNENNYIYNYLITSGHPNLMKPAELFSSDSIKFQSIVKRSDWNTTTNAEVVESFQIAANFAGQNQIQMTEEIFDPLIDAITERRLNLNFDEICSILRHMTLFPLCDSRYSRNFADLWMALDEACLARRLEWTLKQQLHIIDHFHALNLGRRIKFVFEVVFKSGPRAGKLDKNSTLQMLYYTVLCRKSPEEMIFYEKYLIREIDSWAIEEVALIAMAFFKTQTKIRNPDMVQKLYMILERHAPTIEDIPAVNLLKVLRYSSKVYDAPLMLRVVDALMPELDRFSLTTLMHVALLGSDLIQCHEASLEKILRRFNAEFQKIRLKEIERLTFVLGLYGFSTSDGVEKEFCQKVMDSLPNRVDEIAHFPKAFTALLHFLTQCGFASEEYISCALNPEFLPLAHGKDYHLYGESSILLDSFAEINLRDTYKGHRLETRRKNHLCNLTVDYIPVKNSKYKLTKSQEVLLEIQDCIEKLYGDCRIHHLLPHFLPPDVVVIIDRRTGKAVNVGNNIPDPEEKRTGALIYTRDVVLKGIPDAAHLESVVVIFRRMNYTVRHMRKPTGSLRQKCEQLEMCGHKFVVIPFEDWNDASIESKMNLVKESIDTIIKN